LKPILPSELANPSITNLRFWGSSYIFGYHLLKSLDDRSIDDLFSLVYLGNKIWVTCLFYSCKIGSFKESRLGVGGTHLDNTSSLPDKNDDMSTTSGLIYEPAAPPFGITPTSPTA
jgi:hypothetical protein